MAIDPSLRAPSPPSPAPRPAASPNARLALVALQLAAVIAVLYRFRIEEQARFLTLLPLIGGGFVLHALLPRPWRPACFVLLSLTAIGLVLPFPHSAGLIVVALGLIALAHLPVPFWLRVGALIVTAGALAAVRIGWLPSLGWEAFPIRILPVLGAMFMFRLVVYMYDLRHERASATWAERLGYFFLLPNPVFPLFPVIDYQTYRRTYYNADDNSIYEKGVLWMLRGTLHLLLYRAVYQYFVPGSGAITDFGSVVQFMVTTYLLYLRVSGLFHLIVGILCLFGFNLPETHHRYYLASSFNDFWRRINIYWKDFMMKMLYYPVFAALKGLGLRSRMVVATMVVFAGTWIFHSYQYFWLQGTFLLTAPDAAFWGVLGLLVVANSLWEAGRPKTRRIGRPDWNPWHALQRAGQTVVMFATMCILWSMWSSASFGEWLTIIGRGRHGLVPGLGWLALAFATLVGLGVLWQRWGSTGLGFDTAAPPRVRSLVYGLGVPAALLIVTIPPTTDILGPNIATVVQALGRERLNARDKELVDRGYYEGLLVGSQFAMMSAAPPDDGRPDDGTWVQFHTTELARQRADFMGYEMRPSASGVFKSFAFETNRWGMRDRDYARLKPANTLRLGLLGASYEVAGGISQAASYEAVLEDSLNRHPPSSAWSNYEVLNFSVDGYSMLHKLMLYEQRLPEFDIDLAVLTVYASEDNRLLIHLTRAVADGTPIPYPGVAEIIQRSGATRHMAPAIIRARLTPYVDEILRWTFEEFRRAELRGGPKLVTVLLPRTNEGSEVVNQDSWKDMWDAAVAAGLQPVSLHHAFDGMEADAIRLAPWDDHPNVTGHHALAAAMYAMLEHHPAVAASAPGASVGTGSAVPKGGTGS